MSKRAASSWALPPRRHVQDGAALRVRHGSAPCGVNGEPPRARHEASFGIQFVAPVFLRRSSAISLLSRSASSTSSALDAVPTWRISKRNVAPRTSPSAPPARCSI